jgi:hypothetical protein
MSAIQIERKSAIAKVANEEPRKIQAKTVESEFPD